MACHRLLNNNNNNNNNNNKTRIQDAQTTCFTCYNINHTVNIQEFIIPQCSSIIQPTSTSHHSLCPLQIMKVLSLYCQGFSLYIFPLQPYEAPPAVRMGDNFLNLVQADLTPALNACTSPPARSVFHQQHYYMAMPLYIPALH